MPIQRPLHGRHFIGRSRLSGAQALGFSVLSLRETAWFYSVGLLTVAMLIWTPSQATPPRPDRSPTATPESRALPSEALPELPGLVRGFAEEDAIGRPQLSVFNSRRTAPHFLVSRNDRSRRKPVGRATILDIRAAARQTLGTAPQSRGDEGIKTPLRSADG